MEIDIRVICPALDYDKVAEAEAETVVGDIASIITADYPKKENQIFRFAMKGCILPHETTIADLAEECGSEMPVIYIIIYFPLAFLDDSGKKYEIEVKGKSSLSTLMPTIAANEGLSRDNQLYFYFSDTKKEVNSSKAVEKIIKPHQLIYAVTKELSFTEIDDTYEPEPKLKPKPKPKQKSKPFNDEMIEKLKSNPDLLYNILSEFNEYDPGNAFKKAPEMLKAQGVDAEKLGLDFETVFIKAVDDGKLKNNDYGMLLDSTQLSDPDYIYSFLVKIRNLHPQRKVFRNISDSLQFYSIDFIFSDVDEKYILQMARMDGNIKSSKNESSSVVEINEFDDELSNILKLVIDVYLNLNDPNIFLNPKGILKSFGCDVKFADQIKEVNRKYDILGIPEEDLKRLNVYMEGYYAITVIKTYREHGNSTTEVERYL